MKTLTVIARQGVCVPMREGRARITSDTPCTVPDEPYYRRRLADGDLLLHEESPVKISKKTAKE